jgi:hypothetical protein
LTDIKLDIDGRDRRKWRLHMKWLARDIRRANHILKIGLVPRFVATTRKGYHVILESEKRLSRAETVALQVILGSDRIRELLNLYRARRRWQVWNVLFTAKDHYKGGRHVKRRSSRERKRPEMLRCLKQNLK